MQNRFYLLKNRIMQTMKHFSTVFLSVHRRILLFFCYSFAGWVIETGLIWFLRNHFVIRGWLEYGLPVIPLYGFCSLILIKLLTPLKRNPLLVFGLSVIIATVIEYFAGWMLLTIFHLRLWDYSHTPLSFQGIVALPISAAWGLLALLIIYTANEKLQNLLAKIHPLPAMLLAWFLFLYGIVCTGMDTVGLLF